MGNTALLCLVCLHITEPFSVEGIGIFKEACRTAEDFCITGPSKTLISLWCLKNIFGFTSSIRETCPVNRFFRFLLFILYDFFPQPLHDPLFQAGNVGL